MLELFTLLIGLLGLLYAIRSFALDKSKNDAEIAEKVRSSPFLRVSYQRQTSKRKGASILVAFENTGNGPIQFFTADIQSSEGNFKIEHLHGVKASGIGGLWTTLSGTNLLPQERAFASLSLVDAGTPLKPPTIKSDSQFEFIGETEMKVGPFVPVQSGGSVEVTVAPAEIS